MGTWQNSGTIGYWIISFMSVVLVLVVFIVLLVRISFKRMIDTKLEETELKLEHQTTLLETSILVQEKERTRIAADIHDELIGKLIAFQLQLEIPISIAEKNALLSECISTARRISHDLVPPLIELSSLNELIYGILEPFSKLLNCGVYSTVEESKSIDFEVKTQLMRIVQECLANSKKHAQATIVFVQMKTFREYLFLKISDNGSGFRSDQIVSGLGLKNIETRMHYLKGKYKLKTSEGNGTSYLFAIQLNK
ncbi:sensor histidine kinase [Fluviicola taffensis]|uniref:histidine kinase n=1 Tax=Fluviicola taffensis (strain DSM 16823 / NCIMB 13979 / RW262) TaxID=755732 RepID=F2IK82_FLUTR|nr:ATP-binding protein [Fluviicola taffensis]AEA43985.1 putative signal transduction histidine kinase [Fluviicola taffensis DSM 16823]